MLLYEILFRKCILCLKKTAPPPHRAVSSSKAQLTGGKLPLTGITTAPNSAYCEMSVKEGGPLQLQSSEPLYDRVDDSTVCSNRALRRAHRSLPRFAAPQANNKPPHLPPSHPSRSQSLPRGNVAPPTAKESPPVPEDSPMGNRPPAPLPEEARESDEDNDACVYERVVNND